VDTSSHLCLVGMLDALSLKDTKIGLETLEQMGYDPSSVTLLLNRADSDVGITQADVEELLGRAPDVLVGSDRAIPRALTSGQPIVVAEPRSKAAGSYGFLAQKYLSASARGTEAIHSTAAPAANGSGLRRLLLRKAVS
jgi:pilus assembly protein CpaE